jgi:hypothetical protein
MPNTIKETPPRDFNLPRVYPNYETMKQEAQNKLPAEM